MKKILCVLVLFIASISVYAQITLEQSFTNYQFFSVHEVSPGEFMYATYITGNGIVLFDMNYDPKKIITVNASNIPTAILTVKRNLFDTDPSTIEVAYYTNNGGTNLFRVVRDNGIQIFATQCSLGASIFNTNSGAKLIIKATTTEVGIYSLPGTLTKTAFPVVNGVEYLAFPSPTNDYVMLPDGSVVYDMSGNQVSLPARIAGEAQDVRSLAAGVYYYVCPESGFKGRFVKQ